MKKLLFFLISIAVAFTFPEWALNSMKAQSTKMKHFRCAANVTELDDTLKSLIPEDTTVVDVSDCPLITSIPDYYFDGLPHLKGLIIRKTNIREITKRTFSGLDSVQFIDLTESLIMIIEPGAFDGLTKLTKLYLGGIPLEIIPPDLINGLPSLTSWVRPDGTEVRVDHTTSHDVTTVVGNRTSLKVETTPEPDAKDSAQSEDHHYHKTVTIVLSAVIVLLVVFMIWFVCWSLKRISPKSKPVNTDQTSQGTMDSTSRGTQKERKLKLLKETVSLKIENDHGILDSENDQGTLDLQCSRSTGGEQELKLLDETVSVNIENDQGTLDSQNDQGTLDSQNDQGTLDSQNDQGTLDSQNDQGTLNSQNDQSTLDLQCGRGTGEEQELKLLNETDESESENDQVRLDSKNSIITYYNRDSGFYSSEEEQELKPLIEVQSDLRCSTSTFYSCHSDVEPD